MKCIYCQQPCYMEGTTSTILGAPQDEIWGCSYHPTKVQHFLRFIRKQDCKCQEWTDQNCCPRFEHYKTIVSVPHKDERTYLAIFQDNVLHIQSFNGIQAWDVLTLDPVPPNLTPENLIKRLPLWVLYS